MKCSREGCEGEFEPVRKWQKFCSNKCRQDSWSAEAAPKEHPLLEPFEAPEPYDQIIRLLQAWVRELLLLRDA